MNTSLLVRADSVNDNILLKQRTNGLTFGTDALLLASYIEAETGSNALELGAGTGVISLLLLKRKKALNITALEIQPEFAAITKENAAANGLSDSLETICCDLRDYNCLSKYAYVFTNPPYMRCDSGKRNVYDEKNIARHEVMGTILDFCRCASRTLKFGGAFYAVYRPDRLVDLIAAMRECKIEPKRITFVHADAKAPPSMLLVEGKRGAASGLRVTPPLLIYTNEDHITQTNDYEFILSTGIFPDKFRILNAKK